MMPTLMTIAMSNVTPNDSGLASGLFNSTQQVGGALALAVLATVSTSHTNHLLNAGETIPAALNDGYHLAFRIGAAALASAIVIAAVFLRAPKPTAQPETDPTPTRDQPRVDPDGLPVA
jgi:hypothetical protein